MNSDEARVILISKLKGSKDKGISLLKIANAVKKLKDSENKSSEELGKDFDVSKSIINEFYNMSKHPTEIKKLIQEKKIGLDTSTKLFKIKNVKKRIEFAKEVAGLSAMDARYVIDYHRRAPNLSAKECKKFVLNSKTNTQEMHLVVTPLEEEEFKKLHQLAKKNKTSIDQLSRKAILKFLEGVK